VLSAIFPGWVSRVYFCFSLNPLTYLACLSLSPVDAAPAVDSNAIVITSNNRSAGRRHQRAAADLPHFEPLSEFDFGLAPDSLLFPSGKRPPVRRVSVVLPKA
jgi:hypothetical protein